MHRLARGERWINYWDDGDDDDDDDGDKLAGAIIGPRDDAN